MQMQDRIAQVFKQTTRDEEVIHLNKDVSPERQVSTCRCYSTDLTAHTDAATAFHGICYTKGKSFVDHVLEAEAVSPSICFPKPLPLGLSSHRWQRSPVAH